MQYRLLFFGIVFIGLFSCKAPTNVVYFQNSENLEKIPSTTTFTPVFKVDDIISILVSAADMDAARPFNLMQGSSTSAVLGESSGGNSSVEPTYLIDENGNIDFPVVGSLKIAGLNRVQVKELIKEKLKIYINAPIVSVRLKNFKITVMGEVVRPGSFTIPNERITIIEALGLAGDMTIKGQRENVMVIRENEGVNTYHRIDLTSKTIFDSPVYYLAQNDVLYIEPNESRVKESKTRSNLLNVIISMIGVTLSVITLIIR
ncbi:polysaccharide biosynthesis/export family protein [Aquimarina sp. 2201CG1-2-11]|uniref:polysaccharide biosynthesis/export family protein n=1 Tax=Aquimarina discodermiae TaxID=3231043 RepID=UPI00346274D5